MRRGMVLLGLGLGGSMASVVMAPMLMLMVGGTGSGAASSSCERSAPADEPVALDDPDQRANAKAIIATGIRLKIPTRGLIVAIATARQESTLRNLNYGDRDSVGLFQQRTPWGPTSVRLDPAMSAEMFFTGGKGGQRGLLDIRGWESMSITGAAQAVQVSGFPLAYAQWEGLAREVVAQMTGGEPAPCEDPEPSQEGPCKASGDLSDYGNGLIPKSALCPLPFAPGHQLRSDAANAAINLSAAYEGRFGHALCVTDSYRTLAEQYDVYARKPGLAAKPGTSNHGLGVAMDLCDGIQTFGSATHLWMKENAPTFGWIHPGWAEPGGSKPEAWHWEYE